MGLLMKDFRMKLFGYRLGIVRREFLRECSADLFGTYLYIIGDDAG